jgi:Domain of unknown function (DUF4136)
MKCFLSLFFAAAAVLAFSGCATSPTTIYNVQQSNVKGLAGLNSFAWSERTATLGANDIFSNGPVYLNLMRSEVEVGLIAKGYRKVSPKKAALIVDIVFATKPLSKAQADVLFSTKPGAEAVQATGKGYEAGSLVVDLENAKTHVSLWRGSASRTIDRSQPYEVQKGIIHRAVSGLISQVPAAH